MRLLPRDELVEVQQHAAERHPGREFAGTFAPRHRGRPHGRVRIGLERGPLRGDERAQGADFSRRGVTDQCSSESLRDAGVLVPSGTDGSGSHRPSHLDERFVVRQHQGLRRGV